MEIQTRYKIGQEVEYTQWGHHNSGLIVNIFWDEEEERVKYYIQR